MDIMVFDDTLNNEPNKFEINVLRTVNHYDLLYRYNDIKRFYEHEQNIFKQ